MVELGMTDDNFPNVCRLCLQVDDFIVDIFHNLDPNPEKVPLPDRIYDLYQVKVTKSDGLPTSICHTCLFYTEAFSDFKANVRKCEARLQNYLASMGILGNVKSTSVTKDGIKQEIDEDSIEDYLRTIPPDSSLVTVVDPNQEYESSDDGFSLDSDSEFPEPNLKRGVEAILQPNVAEMTNESEEKNNSGLLNDGSAGDGVDRNVYLCQFCDMAFTAQFECTAHENEHDRVNPYSCNYCVYKCSSRQILIAHIKDVHDNDRPYVCIQCHKGFGRRSDLKKHTIVHTGVRPFTCPVCNKNFSRNTNLTKHLRIHTGLKPHVCQKCPRSFTTTADLVRHQRVHNDSKPFQCTKCPSAFTRKDKLLHHERTHMKKEKQGPFGSVATNGDPMIPARHSEGSGNDMENMVISLDPYIDVNQAETSAHNTSTDSLPNTPSKSHPSMLAQADKEGQSQEHVTGDVVLNINSGEDYNNVYSCDYCPQKFTLFSALIHHNSTHNNFKGHVCPVCSKRFMRKRELQRHSVIHTGLKPYSCRFCNKRFNRKDKVVRHERIHTDEKFSCTQCDLDFSKQEALDMHLKVHELNKEAPEQQHLHDHQQFQQHFSQQPGRPPYPYQQSGPPMHNPYYHHGQPPFSQHLPENILRDHPSGAGPPAALLPLLPNVFMPGFMPPQMNFYNELRSDE